VQPSFLRLNLNRMPLKGFEDIVYAAGELAERHAAIA
jgi:hypothetical protein